MPANKHALDATPQVFILTPRSALPGTVLSCLQKVLNISPQTTSFEVNFQECPTHLRLMSMEKMEAGKPSGKGASDLIPFNPMAKCTV